MGCVRLEASPAAPGPRCIPPSRLPSLARARTAGAPERGEREPGRCGAATAAPLAQQHLPREHDEEAARILHELCSLNPQRANKVKKLVSYLSTAVRNRDYDFVSTFITIYSRNTTTWQLLNWIMQRYGPFEEQNKEDQLEKNAIIDVLDLWIERGTNEFCRNLGLPKLNHLMEYVKLHMPSSHLLIHVEELMTKVEEQESMKATPKEEEVADLEPSSAPASASDHQGELDPQEDAVVPKIVEPTANTPPAGCIRGGCAHSS